MAKRIGQFKRSFLYLDDWDHSIDEKVGRFTTKDSSFAEWTPTAMECPYCHATLLGLSGVDDVNRTVSVGTIYDRGRKQRALVHAIPSSHQLLRCKPCRQGFTVPISAGAQLVAVLSR